MSDSSRVPANIDRINLRLPAQTFSAIDQARGARPGHVSRNTWLTEAVEEKLARDATNVAQPQGLRHA